MPRPPRSRESNDPFEVKWCHNMKSLRNILSSSYGVERGKCLATLLFHHHPTQVHYWPHCSSITTLHKYTTGHTTLPSPPYTSTPLATLLFHHHPTQVHHWPLYSSITTLHKYTTGHTTLPSPPYTSTPLVTLLFHHHPTQVHHWPHCSSITTLHKYTTGPITTLHKYTTGHTTLPSPPYTSTPLATLLFHHHLTQVHHWPHYSSITTLHKYTTGHTTLPSPPYTSTPLVTLLFHHHPTQVHHWPHYSSITTPHKYTTGHAPSITTYTSTPLATLLFHHRPTQVHYWPLPLHHHPTQAHHWPHYSSITTLHKYTTGHTTLPSPPCYKLNVQLTCQVPRPPRSRESNDPFEEKRCHYMKSLRNILSSSYGGERDQCATN